MRKLIIILILLVPVITNGEESRYTGTWINKGIFIRISSGIEPKEALKNCGSPTTIIFSGNDELIISWNNHESSPMEYKRCEDGSIETLGRTPSGIRIGMRYRILIRDQDGMEVLSVYSIEPEEEKQDELVRYPEKYGAYFPPQGMIISLFLAGDYSPLDHPDSTITIYADGRIKGLASYSSLSVGYDCVEESSQNHVYFHHSTRPGRNYSGDSFVWSRTADTLSFHRYEWDDLLFNGTIGKEYLTLIKK